MRQLIRLSWRNLWRNRRRTLLSIGSIGFGLALFVIFVALYDGMYGKIVEDAVRIRGGHLTLEHPGYLDTPSPRLSIGPEGDLTTALGVVPGLERTQAMVISQGLLQSSAAAIGVTIVGLRARDAALSPPGKKLVSGQGLADGDSQVAVLGRLLARRMKVAEGKKIVLSVSNVRGETVQELFRVKGVYEVGAPEIDGALVQVPIESAQRLLGLAPGQVNRVGLVLKDPQRLEEIAALVVGRVSSATVRVRRWEESLPDLASFIRVDRGVNLIFNLMLCLTILMSVFNTFWMAVLERGREFAVLLALGTPARYLRAQVFLENVWMALLGCLCGLALGGGVSYIVQLHGIDVSGLMPPGGTSVSGFALEPTIHTLVQPQKLLWLGAGMFLATLLLGLYPVSRAARPSVLSHLR